MDLAVHMLSRSLVLEVMTIKIPTVDTQILVKKYHLNLLEGV